MKRTKAKILFLEKSKTKSFSFKKNSSKSSLSYDTEERAKNLLLLKKPQKNINFRREKDSLTLTVPGKRPEAETDWVSNRNVLDCRALQRNNLAKRR